MLFCRRFGGGAVTTALSAVGRTAFSNYLLQTLIATTIFYGHGLGLFGSVTRVEQAGIVVAIWAVQIVLSVVWLRFFQFGPMEWVWRTVTYGKRQPLTR
jgi:Predicted membrane protein